MKPFNNSFFCGQIINKIYYLLHGTEHVRLGSLKINTCDWKAFLWQKNIYC